MHIELKIFPCTASNKRKEVGSENTKERALSITKSDSETVMTSGKMVDYTRVVNLKMTLVAAVKKLLIVTLLPIRRMLDIL